MINRHSTSLGFVLVSIFMLGHSFLILSKPVREAPQVSGYDITVTESMSTMTYGGPYPTFRAQLTIPASDPPPNTLNFLLVVDSQSYEGSVSDSGSGSYSLYVNSVGSITTLAVGQHSAIAKFNSVKLGMTIESTPVTFTILKATPELSCTVNNLSYTYAINYPLTITMSLTNTQVPVDWQDATFTIKFVGKQTFTDANLVPNSSEEVVVNTPSVTDNYQLQCIFDGTSSFNSAGFDLNAIVSEQHKPGQILLYTNPTTVKAGHPAEWYVVVPATPGLPTPTGQIGLTVGGNPSRPIPLGPDGTVLIQGNAPYPLTSNTTSILYFGDPVYSWSIANFSLTNPPIPSGTGSPPQATNTPKPSAEPTSSPSLTPISTSTVASNIPTGNSKTDGGTTSSPPGQENTMKWVLLSFLGMLVGGSAGGFFVLRKRTAAISNASRWHDHE